MPEDRRDNASLLTFSKDSYAGTLPMDKFEETLRTTPGLTLPESMVVTPESAGKAKK